MNLKKQAVLFVNGCILFACLCFGIIGYMNASNGFHTAYSDRVANDAERIRQLFDARYPGNWEIKDNKLYKGKQLMEGLTGEIDSLAGGDAITIFKDNTRVSTTISNGGQREVNTQCSDEIYKIVVSKSETFNTENNSSNINSSYSDDYLEEDDDSDYYEEDYYDDNDDYYDDNDAEDDYYYDETSDSYVKKQSIGSRALNAFFGAGIVATVVILIMLFQCTATILVMF